MFQEAPRYGRFNMTEIIHRSGYIAFSGVLVVSAVTLGIVTSIALFSVSSAQTTLEDTKESTSLMLAESCTEDVLMQIHKNNAVVSPVVLPQGNCTVTVNSHVGNDWTFTVNETLSGYTKSIQVSATRTTSVTVTSWQEL